MNPILPQVVDFGPAYDVSLETVDQGTRVVARLKTPKNPPSYRRFHDLPFVQYDPATQSYKPWGITPGTSPAEQEERGRYYWNEFVRYARGTHRARDKDAMHHTVWLLYGLMGRDWGQSDEARVFIGCLAEALVTQLRAGMVPPPSDPQAPATPSVGGAA